MLLHHGKHHAKYVETTNVLAGATAQTFPSLEAVVRAAAEAGDQKLFNNAAQAWNHAFFWASMTPRESRPSGALLRAIEAAFGGMGGLRDRFIAEGAGHFGSGWVWLIVRDEVLVVTTTHDADTALIKDGVPLLVCDLWEHAYYLDHKSDRVGYLAAWWDALADWAFAAAQYDAARGARETWCYADAEQTRSAGA